MKTALAFLVLFLGVNLILWLGSQLMDRFQWLAEALIITGIAGLILVWLRIALGKDE
jgi:hypothetical protein